MPCLILVGTLEPKKQMFSAKLTICISCDLNRKRTGGMYWLVKWYREIKSVEIWTFRAVYTCTLSGWLSIVYPNCEEIGQTIVNLIDFVTAINLHCRLGLLSIILLIITQDYKSCLWFFMYDFSKEEWYTICAKCYPKC